MKSTLDLTESGDGRTLRASINGMSADSLRLILRKPDHLTTYSRLWMPYEHLEAEYGRVAVAEAVQRVALRLLEATP